MEHESGIVRNQPRILSVLFAGSVYLWLVGSASRIGSEAVVLFLLYSGSCVLVAKLACDRELRLIGGTDSAFRKNFPFKHYGENFGHFQHVFFAPGNVLTKIVSGIGSDTSARTGLCEFSAVEITDVDKMLIERERRSFFVAHGGSTIRGSKFSLVIYTSKLGETQSIHWWVLVRGFVDRNRLFSFLAAAPLMLPFWILPYVRRQHDIVSRLRTVYPGFYNDLDVASTVRILHDAVFDSLVSRLDEEGIDTSDLKVQRAQTLNIHVSGGRANFGNVVQGAANRIQATLSKGKAAA